MPARCPVIPEAEELGPPRGTKGSLESSGPRLSTLLVLFSGGAACPDGPDEFPCFGDRHRAPGG
jgi:hypothetical protein